MHLQKRYRILRSNPAIRNMVAETTLTPADFIEPVFLKKEKLVVYEILQCTAIKQLVAETKMRCPYKRNSAKFVKNNYHGYY